MRILIDIGIWLIMLLAVAIGGSQASLTTPRSWADRMHECRTRNPDLGKAADDLVDHAGGTKQLILHDDCSFGIVLIVLRVPETTRSPNGDRRCGKADCEPKGR